jgi:hypothetical protein
VIVWREALRDSRVSAYAKLVGLVLSTYLPARGVGFAYPRLGLLAVGASCSGRQVSRKIAELEAAGFLEIDRSVGGSTHRYYSTVPDSASPHLRAEWLAATRTLSPPTRTLSPPTPTDSPPNRAIAEQDARHPQRGRGVCPECETGSGLHSADCIRAEKGSGE